MPRLDQIHQRREQLEAWYHYPSTATDIRATQQMAFF